MAYSKVLSVHNHAVTTTYTHTNAYTPTYTHACTYTYGNQRACLKHTHTHPCTHTHAYTCTHTHAPDVEDIAAVKKKVAVIRIKIQLVSPAFSNFPNLQVRKSIPPFLPPPSPT